jgi:cell division septum initiation protein DivIVA
MEELDTLKNEIEVYKKQILELQQENTELKEHLKKYTNGKNNKRYYEKNKEKVKEQGANYLKKLTEENPEKIKEYRRNAYLKRKAKLQNTES